MAEQVSDPVAAPIPGAASMLDALSIGQVTFRNRVFFAPTSVGYAADGVFTQAAIEHYGRRALGGAGAVMTEHFAVSEQGWQHRRQPAAWPDAAFRRGLEQVAQEIRGNGAVAIAQISHAGRYAGPWDEWTRIPRLAPSAVPFPLLGAMVTPQEISVEQIEEVVEAFAATTRFLVETGWQGIEIHGGSGFLISSFLSPLLNRRTDRYGGSIVGRVRFAQEVVQACREAAAGDAFVGLHLMTDELVPGGVRPTDVAELVPLLEEAGVQFIRPGSGTFETLRLPENGARAAGTDFNRSDADALVAVASVPIVANGGLRTADDVAGALQGGAAAVALSRPLLADPDWVVKMRADAGDAVVGCPCSPPLCLQTQLGGALCASWPDDVREQGFFGYAHPWRPAGNGCERPGGTSESTPTLERKH